MNNIRKKVNPFLNDLKMDFLEYLNILKHPFKSFKNTLITLLSFYILITFIIFTIVCIMGGFFTLNTDDIVQYYPFMEGFIKKVKTGQLSLYDNSFFMGTSVYASTYYIPFDIFTLLTLLFSFLMPTSRAYGLVNLLKIGSSGIMMALFLNKKGFKNKTVFLYSLIYSFGGILACECVFPVYWSLLFYIPLGVYIIELFLNNKKTFSFITLYTFIIILYDFYIAYMLLAFIMIYLVIVKIQESGSNIVGKNNIFKNKYLYIDILSVFGLILIGLLMSMIVFLPSYIYITDKTTRQSVEECLWYYTPIHYLNILSTYFITSNPLSILLKHGDYLRNHCSMFITIFGLFFLILFFFTKGYKNHVLKFFVILFNILMGIPLVSMIMTGTNQGYIRWFFIVYFINLFASCYSFEYYDGKVTNWYHKITILGLFLFAVLFITKLFFFTEDFITYNDSDFKIPIVVIMYVFIGLYIISLFLPHQKLTTYILALVEVITSGVVIFVNVGNTYTYYEWCIDRFDDMEYALKEFTTYDYNNAYRVGVITNEANYMTNVSFMYNKFNTTQFFHSFYDKTANDLYGNIYTDKNCYWSRRETYTLSGPFAILDGVKYAVVPNDRGILLPDCYKIKAYDTYFSYYEIDDFKPFILYDSIYQTKSSDILAESLNLIQYGYIYNENEDDTKSIIKKYNFKETSSKSINDLNSDVSVTSCYSYNATHEIYDNKTYAVYDISKMNFKGDSILYIPINENDRSTIYNDSYILDTNGNRHYTYFGLCKYESTYTPDKLCVVVDNESSIPYLKCYSFDMQYILDTYLNNQTYQNEEFILDGTKMTIKLDYDKKSYDRILKTNFTYSEEWKVKGNTFETINIDGGYLGIIIPKNSSNCNIELNFEPNGYKLGSSISAFSISIFSSVCLAYYINLFMNKKLREWTI